LQRRSPVNKTDAGWRKEIKKRYSATREAMANQQSVRP
jgi:hypothetical protein